MAHARAVAASLRQENAGQSKSVKQLTPADTAGVHRLLTATYADTYSSAGGLDDSLAELDLDNYDNDDLADQRTVAKGVFGTGNPGMAFYRSNLEDPYMTSTRAESASDSQEEDAQLQPSDFVIVSGRHEDDVSLLEARSPTVFMPPVETLECSFRSHSATCA